MKIRVRVGGHEFDVEVGDLQSRPIVAMVDDERFEIWPEEERAERGVLKVETAAPEARVQASSASTDSVSPSSVSSRRPSSPSASAAASAGDTQRVVLAPLPGSVDSVAVQPGDTVTAGQPLCVIEAMKMKNVIRAPHNGEIAAVRIAGGQHVKHGDVLVEFAD